VRPTEAFRNDAGDIAGAAGRQLRGELAGVARVVAGHALGGLRLGVVPLALLVDEPCLVCTHKHGGESCDCNNSFSCQARPGCQMAGEPLPPCNTLLNVLAVKSKGQSSAQLQHPLPPPPPHISFPYSGPSDRVAQIYG